MPDEQTAHPHPYWGDPPPGFIRRKLQASPVLLRAMLCTLLVFFMLTVGWLYFNNSYRDCLMKYDHEWSAMDGMDRMMRQPPDDSRAADNCSNGNVLPDFLLY